MKQLNIMNRQKQTDIGGIIAGLLFMDKHWTFQICGQNTVDITSYYNICII